MTYIYRLAGENLELAEAELRGFLRSQGIDESPERTGRLAFTQSHPGQLKRLALTHEISEKKDLEAYTPTGSFKVNAKTGNNPQELEERLGDQLSSPENTVDLENPDTEINAYQVEDSLVIGEQVQKINRGLYQERSNEKRPYSAPVSLDPVLARVMVNLSEAKPGDTVLDPFCGTGGILIEAGLCGCAVRGFDAQREMVTGTERNLENYGVINHEVEAEKIQDSSFNSADVVVTDLPYGKSSAEKGNPVKAFLEKIKEFDGPAVFMYDEPRIEGLEPVHEIYIHGSLTRYIFIRR